MDLNVGVRRNFSKGPGGGGQGQLASGHEEPEGVGCGEEIS